MSPVHPRQVQPRGLEADLKTLEIRIATLDDPRSLGAPLKGEHESYWRWRIGDYRVMARIEDERITILVVRVAHRREVYR